MLVNPQLIPAGRYYPIATRAIAITQNIPLVVSAVATMGYASVNDYGGGTYERVAVQPTHAGKFQSNDGAWWELRTNEVTPQMFGAKGDADRVGAGTDDTTAIQNAMDYPHAMGFYLPGGSDDSALLYKISSITINIRKGIRGDGPKASVLRQIATETDPAIMYQTGVPPAGSGAENDIAEGAIWLHRFGIEVAPLANSVGIEIGDTVLASNIVSDQLRIENQWAETLGPAPYTYPVGSSGIKYNAGGGSAIFLNSFRNLEIRSFENGIDIVVGPVNELNLQNTWIIDCLRGINQDGAISSCMFNMAIESGVTNARYHRINSDIGNCIWIGSRAELTQGGVYMFEFTANFTALHGAQNCRVLHVNTTTLGDGAAWPGKKYTGTLPEDFIFYLEQLGNELIGGASTMERIMTYALRLGGNTFGDANILLGRSGGGADGRISNEAAGNLRITGGNDISLSGDGDHVSHLIRGTPTTLGFLGTAPSPKKDVSGSRASGTALNNLLGALAAMGLITNSTTA